MGVMKGCPVHGDIGVDFCAEHDRCEMCMIQGLEPDCCEEAQRTQDGLPMEPLPCALCKGAGCEVCDDTGQRHEVDGSMDDATLDDLAELEREAQRTADDAGGSPDA